MNDGTHLVGTIESYPGERAEREVAGTVAGSAWGARFARGRVDPDDFHDPRLRRVYEAAARIDAIGGIPYAEAGVTSHVVRAAAISVISDEHDLRWLIHLIESRSSLKDVSGLWARRMAAAAERRRQLVAIRDAELALERGLPIDDRTRTALARIAAA